LSTNTGVWGCLNAGEASLSSSPPELSSSSETAVLCGTLFVPPLNKPWLVCARLRLRTGPVVDMTNWSSVAALMRTFWPIPMQSPKRLLFFFFAAVRGLYPANWYSSGNAFRNRSLKSVERLFWSWNTGSLTIVAQTVPCFSYPALSARSSSSVNGRRRLLRVFSNKGEPSGRVERTFEERWVRALG